MQSGATLKDSRGGNVTVAGQPIQAIPQSQVQQQQPIVQQTQAPSGLQQAAVAQVMEVPVTYQNVAVPQTRAKNFYQQNMNNWLGQEEKKIAEWRQQQLSNGHDQAGNLEKQLRQQALEKQRVVEEEDRIKRERFIKEWDQEKQFRLREIDNNLQNMLQYELLKNKHSILQLDSEANNRRFELLRNAQMKSCEDMDKLGQQFQQQQLQPSVTETTIITNTHPVKLNDQGKLQDVPVQQQQPMQSFDAPQMGRPLDSGVQMGRQLDSTTGIHQQPQIGGVTGQRSHIDAAYGRDIPTTDHLGHATAKNTGIHEITSDEMDKRNAHDRSHLTREDDLHNKPRFHDDDLHNKHATTDDTHSRGLLGKVKDVLSGNKHEPTSTESQQRRV